MERYSSYGKQPPTPRATAGAGLGETATKGLGFAQASATIIGLPPHAQPANDPLPTSNVPYDSLAGIKATAGRDAKEKTVWLKIEGCDETFATAIHAFLAPSWGLKKLKASKDGSTWTLETKSVGRYKIIKEYTDSIANCFNNMIASCQALGMMKSDLLKDLSSDRSLSKTLFTERIIFSKAGDLTAEVYIGLLPRVVGEFFYC